MIRPPPRSTRTDTLFPYPTLFRSPGISAAGRRPARLPFRRSPAAVHGRREHYADPPGERYLLARRPLRPRPRADRRRRLLPRRAARLSEGAAQHLHRRLGHRQPDALAGRRRRGGKGRRPAGGTLRLANRAGEAPTGAEDPPSVVGLLHALRP